MSQSSLEFDEDGNLIGGFEQLIEAARHEGWQDPINWATIDPEARLLAIEELSVFVADQVLAFPHLDHRLIPPCWYKHDAYVRVLGAAKGAYDGYHSDKGGPTGPMNFYTEWVRLWPELRMLGAVCQPTHEPDAPQLWAVNFDPQVTPAQISRELAAEQNPPAEVPGMGAYLPPIGHPGAPGASTSPHTGVGY